MPTTTMQRPPRPARDRPAITLDDLLSTPISRTVRDGIVSAELSPDQQVQSYESSFREANAAGGSIYGDMGTMPAIVQAAHERRMELLDGLPIGDVSDKVCVDYGVGSWGFACIYPRLQRCAYAVGIDISHAAITESAAVSARGAFPYGTNYAYLTSRGDDLQLKDRSVDIFFAGECVEHVENTDAFLDEIHRVLKPGGQLILTTPNADAYLYRINGERYGVGPEHVALMGYAELGRYLDPRFEMVVAHGFNGSFHHSWDEKITDGDFARRWARQFSDRPDLATGVVLMARRRDDYRSARYVQRYRHHDAPEIHYAGPWQTVPLHKAMTGRLGSGGDASSLHFEFAGCGLILNFWSHPWSGHAVVEVDGQAQEINLYSAQGGFSRLHIGDLEPTAHRLCIRGSRVRDVRSQGDEVIFYQAIAYERR